MLWEQTGIEAILDHVRQHSDGKVSGELHINSKLPPLEGQLILRTISNIIGIQTVPSLVKTLNEHNTGIEWAPHLELFFTWVLKASREGEPPIIIADEEPNESAAYRVFPFVHEGHPNILFGKGGSFKSGLAGWLALRVALGDDAEPGNVLILDFEMSQQDWVQRLHMLCDAIEKPVPSNIIYRYCKQPLADETENVHGWILEHNIDMLLIDSALPACGGRPEESEPVLSFFRALRDLDKTSLIISHQNQEKETTRPYGNVNWWNLGRSIMQVTADTEGNKGELAVGVYHRKSNFGKLIPPQGFKATFTTATPYQYTKGDTLMVKTTNILDNEALASQVSVRVQIEKLLARGSQSMEWLKENVAGAHGHDVEEAVKQMVSKNQLHATAYGTYGLPTGTFHQPPGGAS